MSALVEAGLRRILDDENSEQAHPDSLAPLPTCRCGGLLVDIANREELYRVMEEGDSLSPQN